LPYVRLMLVNAWTATIPMERVRLGFASVRFENDIRADFPADVVAEARRAVAGYVPPGLDWTDFEFVTLDPAGSTDLDQAFHIEAMGDGAGFRVRYAIADVPAFVNLGGRLDAETRQRGETIYCPDLKVPLHPPVLSDDAASLLPGVVRGAYVWQFDVADDGVAAFVSLQRASVRSRAQLTYDVEQGRLEGGAPHPQIGLLREVGIRRQAQEVARGAINLPSPAQEVRADDRGGIALVYRTSVPVEEWNAQLSLMTGMAAARIMLDGRVGILRTMPPPSDQDLARVRASARGLGIAWPEGRGYAHLIRSLDPGDPQHAAFLDNVTTLMRGAGYTAFDGAAPTLSEHSAIAGPYAHVTAPLRRLVDRFGLAACLALVQGRDVPDELRAVLPDLPALMSTSGKRARVVDRASMDYLEAELLAGREGVALRGVVIEQRKNGGIVQLAEPAITARCRGNNLPLGEWVDAWLVEADPKSRSVVFDVSQRRP